MSMVPKESLPGRIFRELRTRIVHLKYPPGTSLSEKDLCEEFKVSRISLREAFRKLQDVGLVAVIPRYGTYVTPMDINEIRSAFEVKTKLEGLAGELAAKRIRSDRLQL
jgi:DNA-binding GntR family transcriptional regulator